jgi:hypothetical protein
MTNAILPIQKMIYEVRGFKVMLDRDLAALYEVEVKRLNEAVKRNIKRFPSDFMFQLTDEELDELLRSQFATSKNKQGGRRYNPYVFTEQGVSMLSSVINSDRAIEVNIQIMRIFVKLRQYALSKSSTNKQITELRKLLMLHIENSDYKFTEHDEAIRQILLALNNLIEKPKESKKIGFGN